MIWILQFGLLNRKNQFKSKNLYDVVLSTAVIEHIFDVKGFLKKFNDLVEVFGIVIIVTNDTGTPS